MSRLAFANDPRPLGTLFHAEIKRMMVAFGDAPEPRGDSAALLESEGGLGCAAGWVVDLVLT